MSTVDIRPGTSPGRMGAGPGIPARRRAARLGAGIMALASLVGLAVSLYNYTDRGSGIAGEPGTILVIVATAILLAAALVLARVERPPAFLRWFLVVGCLVGILGTALAAYLLESGTLLMMMVVALAGWLLHLSGRRKR